MFLLRQRKFDFQLHKDFPFHLPKSKIFSCKLSTLFESAYKCLNYIAGHTLRCECVWQCVCVYVCFTLVTSQISGKTRTWPAAAEAFAMAAFENILFSQRHRNTVRCGNRHTLIHIHTCIHAASPPCVCVCVQCGCINKAFSCRRTTKITRCKAQSTVHIPAW